MKLKGYFKMRLENSKIKERRKKRVFLPIVYFILELTLAWLVFVILQISYNPLDWAVWSQVLMILFVIYAFFKMLHIYNRQKDYPET
jgi:hypothetical protein